MYGKLDFLHAAFGLVPSYLDGYESTIDSPAFDIRNADSNFLLNVFLRKNFYLYYGEQANGSRKAKRIHQKDFLNMPITVPNYTEQYKISILLKKLDSTITLLQRKVEYLRVCLTNELKELILHSVPTQTVMFNDIIDTISLKNYITKENINNGKYNILQQGDDPNFGFSNMIPYKNYEKVILFGDHTLSIYKPKSPFLVSTDGVKGITSATIDIKFLHLLLVLFKPKSQGYKRHLSILKDTKVTFPKDKDIQIKLGKLFYKEQNYLKQEENRIHELKKLKQFLLQNMFI